MENAKNDHFERVSESLGERKSDFFLPLARSRNPQNPRILDNLEGKPLGLLADSAGQNNLIFSYLISAEVLRFLKFYIR